MHRRTFALCLFFWLFSLTLGAQENAPTMEWGVSFDAIASSTEAEDVIPESDTARLRSAQFQLHAPFGEWGRAQFALDGSDGSYGFDAIFREANLWVEDMPYDLALRIGRFYPTLGAWNDVLPSGGIAPSIDGVRRAYLGGNLSMDGFELHQIARSQSARWHWSFGGAATTHGQDADRPGNGIDEANADLRGFPMADSKGSGHAHIDVQTPFAGGQMTLGASALYTRHRKHWLEVAGPAVVESELPRWLLGLDATWRHTCPDGATHLLTFELWHDNREFMTDVVSVASDSRGVWGAFEWKPSAAWSLGVLGSHWRVPDQQVRDFASYHAAWLGWSFARQQELRLFVDHRNPGDGQEKWFCVGFQWTWTMGSPRRATAWF